MRKRLKIVLGAALVLGISALDAALYPRFETRAPRLNLAKNAIWLHFDWARGKSRESTSSLAARLQKDGFQDAYFHVRYIGKSGRLRFRDARAARRLNAESATSAASLALTFPTPKFAAASSQKRSF